MASTQDSAGPAAGGLPAGPAEDAAASRVLRFTRSVRLVHRSTAWLMLVCLTTAACLYLPPLAQFVGRRHLLTVLHEWSGILLPAPALLGLASPSFREDLRRLNRFAPYDRRWLRSALRRMTTEPGVPAGKFNAGQKIYAGWTAGAVVVMAMTGLLMWFTGVLTGLSRGNAIAVHDWFALAVAAVLAGHIRMARRDPEARRGMRTGWVRRRWADDKHARWSTRDRDDAGGSGHPPGPAPTGFVGPPAEDGCRGFPAAGDRARAEGSGR